MTLVMAYGILLTAALAGVAALGDHVARLRGGSRRWLWAAALLLVVPAMAAVMTVPRAPEPAPPVLPASAGSSVPEVLPALRSADSSGSVLRRIDATLAIAWLMGSAVLLVTLVGGQWRVRREARRARPGMILGHDVLLTENLGPAVAGFARPIVFIPGWVVALDTASQRLLLAHELEHVRRRDTLLLMAGAIVTALLPWNPVVWWLASRLRVAVELDCDRRVLATNPDIRPYVDLLLLAADRPRLTSRLQAAHFGERASDLSRRIDAMTDRGPGWRHALATVAVAGVLIALACEAPRPDPVAPKGEKAKPVAATSADVLYEYQVDQPVRMAVGSATPQFPDILRQAGVEGEVLVSFVVDEMGRADAATFKVLRSTHDLFAAAVRKALPAMEFVPAEVGGKKVKQYVEQPFSFAIAGARGPGTSTAPRDSSVSVEVPVADGATPQFRFRAGPGEAQPVGILVQDSRGTELARIRQDFAGLPKERLQEIPVEDIAAVEVIKGPGCAQMFACPMLTIRLKPGRTYPAPAPSRER